MAPFEDFESLLKDVVQAKRLSASKMGNLTEIAMKSMEYDTQLVSILYRTHKSLPPPAKVSSLYVFDALCRAARHQVNKQGITGDINSPTGNCATFLLKVEGVLEGLFQDMLMIGSSESKEKTKKILDIWVKGNTFPTKILSQLTDAVEGKEKVSEMKPLMTSDPRMAGQSVPSVLTPPASAGSPVTPAMDPQAALLALLAQAANAAATPAQTTPNIGLGTAGLDAAQLAVLQQLALAQTASSAAPSHPTPQALPLQSGSSFPGASSYQEEPDNIRHKDRRKNQPQSPPPVNAYNEQFDERPTPRGGFRGGFRRWRGEGRRWDERDRDRYKDQRDDRSPARKARRSRSRSPPSRYGGRRDVRLYSPPRRPSGSWERRGSPDRPRDSDKDEFGRDIRPQSPKSDTPLPPKINTVSSPPPPPPDRLTKDNSPTPALASNHDQMSLTSSIAANTSSDTHSAPFVSSVVSVQSGMEKFNPATFDFTSPSSWEALGKMWQVTNGYLPTTEQLMQFVISAQASLAGTSLSEQNWSSSSPQGWTETNRGSGSFGGGGEVPSGNGNARGGQGEWAYSHSNHNTGSDAIVLGETLNSSPDVDVDDTSQTLHTRGGGGGRMQKVGDKWVFVRESVS